MTVHPSDQTLGDTGEFTVISEIVRDLPDAPDVLVGPGDDAAVLQLDGPMVTSIDVLVEGVHFRRDWSEARDVGRKAVAVNVADVEAMGARPVGIVIGFSAPADTPLAWALDFAAGVREECATAGVALLGGDITRARDITVAGTAFGALGERAAIRRGGAQNGQIVAVTGRLGWAAAGVAVLGRGFRSPRAVVEAQRVPHVPYGAGVAAAEAGATSMIDISDGLLADLGHVATASGVVIDIARDSFDVPEPLQAVAAATGSDPHKVILTGGEDHALVATFAADAALPEGWTRIGHVRQVAGDEEPTVLVDGVVWADEAGWDHFGGGRR